VCPVEIGDVRLFHLPRVERWLVFDYGGEVNDSVMGRAEDNPESFKLFDVGFEVHRLRFQFVLDFCDLLVVDLEF